MTDRTPTSPTQPNQPAKSRRSIRHSHATIQRARELGALRFSAGRIVVILQKELGVPVSQTTVLRWINPKVQRNHARKQRERNRTVNTLKRSGRLGTAKHTREFQEHRAAVLLGRGFNPATVAEIMMFDYPDAGWDLKRVSDIAHKAGITGNALVAEQTPNLQREIAQLNRQLERVQGKLGATRKRATKYAGSARYYRTRLQEVVTREASIVQEVIILEGQLEQAGRTIDTLSAKVEKLQNSATIADLTQSYENQLAELQRTIAQHELTIKILEEQIEASHTRAAATSPVVAATPLWELFDRLVAQVCQVYGLTPNQLQLRTREGSISHARQLIWFVLRETTDAKSTELARLFGGYNHSTVLHAIKAVQQRCQRDPELDRLARWLIQDTLEQ